MTSDSDHRTSNREYHGNRRNHRRDPASFLAGVAAVCCCLAVAGMADGWVTPPPMGLTTAGEVVDVYDGDTLTVRVVRDVKVRVRDCWAPELRTKDAAEKAAGEKARDRLRELCLGKRVRIHVPAGKVDEFGDELTFGRVVADVFEDKDDGRSLAAVLIEEGLAAPDREGHRERFPEGRYRN